MMNMRTLGLVILAALLAVPAWSQTVKYVDQTVMGGADDGSNWANAYTTLDRALDPTVNVDLTLGLVELRLHDGQTYIPDGTHVFPSNSLDVRASTFFMIDTASISGGWDGTETGTFDEPQGDPRTTILSGDRGVPDFTADNCYHVVVPQDDSPSNTQELSRVTIIRGSADATSGHATRGGGIYCAGARLDCDELLVQDNFAMQGGGIALVPHLSGAQNFFKMKRSRLINNGGADKGGAFYSITSGPTHVVNCTFRNNGAGTLQGGAIALDSGVHDVLFVNCRIYDNSTRLEGGGVWLEDPECGSCGYFFVNCTIAFNSLTSSTGMGEGVYIRAGETGNSPQQHFHNTIIWNNPEGPNDDNVYVDVDAMNTSPASINVTHSCIGPRDPGMPGTLTAGGSGFLDGVDPVFVSESNRNLRLQSTSPCINAGDDNLLPSDFTDIDDDGFPSEALPREFFMGDEQWVSSNDTTRESNEGPSSSFGIDSGPTGIADMGAYEFRTYATGPQ